MSEKKQLTDEELENVNGGCGESWSEKMSKYLPAGHGRHIGMYDADKYLEQRFYAVNDTDREIVYWGILKSSYEKVNEFYGNTWHVHGIYVEGNNGHRTHDEWTGTIHEFDADNTTLFLYN